MLIANLQACCAGPPRYNLQEFAHTLTEDPDDSALHWLKLRSKTQLLSDPTGNVALS